MQDPTHEFRKINFLNIYDDGAGRRSRGSMTGAAFFFLFGGNCGKASMIGTSLQRLLKAKNSAVLETLRSKRGFSPRKIEIDMAARVRSEMGVSYFNFCRFCDSM